MSGGKRSMSMTSTPAFTINLLRTLFVAFTACVGTLVSDSISEQPWIGTMAGIAFGLAVVLADRLLRGFSLRLFSSATFGLLMGAVFARLLLASQLLRGLSEERQWIAGLLVYATAGYLGMMLAARSNREEFSIIIPFVRFRRAPVQDAAVL